MKPSNLLSIETRLRSDFRTLTTKLGADDALIQRWSDELISRYTEPQRYYHTIEHIYSMLICHDSYHYMIVEETIIKLAIFFHDWIYNPRGKENELESIRRFKEFAADINLADSKVTRVSEYIEHTITHTLPINNSETDSDLRLFLDFDLEVLSRKSADYALYAAQIRQEYSHFSEAEYCGGRSKVLKAFLQRDRLYFSDEFYEMHEKDARANLENEIETLGQRLRTMEGNFMSQGSARVPGVLRDA